MRPTSMDVTANDRLTSTASGKREKDVASIAPPESALPKGHWDARVRSILRLTAGKYAKKTKHLPTMAMVAILALFQNKASNPNKTPEDATINRASISKSRPTWTGGIREPILFFSLCFVLKCIYDVRRQKKDYSEKRGDIIDAVII